MQGILNQSFIMLKYACKTTQSMNKLAIPSILAATVLIAGIFAFMPVEKASTIHVGLEDKIDELESGLEDKIDVLESGLNETMVLKILEITDSDLDDGDEYMLSCDQAFAVTGITANIVKAEIGTSLTVSAGGKDVTLPISGFTSARPGNELIQRDIAAHEDEANGVDNVMIVAAEATDTDDEVTVIKASIHVPNNGMCWTSQTTP